MASKKINQFELAVLLERASNDVDTLAKILDLGKLTRAINAHFTTEDNNGAGDTRTAGSTGNVTT